MYRVNVWCLVLTSIAPFLVSGQTGTEPVGTEEIRSLKNRVAELESQNRAILEALRAIQARMEPQASPTAAVSPMSAPAPASPPLVSAAPKNAVRWDELTAGGFNRLKFYGFLRLDLDLDSQRPNLAETPFFIASPDPALGGKQDAGNFAAHPRLTRFGVDYFGPKVSGLGNFDLTGKLEFDFENGGTESRQLLRLRQAYLQLKKGDFAILAGQTWDVFSPLFPTVNNDSLLWNAGNVGDRRPQFRVSYEPKVGKGRWSMATAIGLTGAIDSQDLDNNTYRDGEESGRPNVQARLGYTRPLWVAGQEAGFGVSAFYGWENTSRPIVDRTLFHVQTVNIDYTLPLARMLSLRGEAWWGRNMSDVRGGAGQGINILNAREIRGRGGWAELTIRPSRYYSFHPGFSLDIPVAGDVPDGGRTRNQVFYLGNRITPGGNFTIGADYLRWWTSFQGYKPALDNRVNLFFQYAY